MPTATRVSTKARAEPSGEYVAREDPLRLGGSAPDGDGVGVAGLQSRAVDLAWRRRPPTHLLQRPSPPPVSHSARPKAMVDRPAMKAGSTSSTAHRSGASGHAHRRAASTRLAPSPRSGCGRPAPPHNGDRRQLRGQLALVGAVGVHGPQVVDPAAVGQEHDLIRERRQRRPVVKRQAERLGERAPSVPTRSAADRDLVGRVRRQRGGRQEAEQRRPGSAMPAAPGGSTASSEPATSGWMVNISVVHRVGSSVRIEDDGDGVRVAMPSVSSAGMQLLAPPGRSDGAEAEQELRSRACRALSRAARRCRACSADPSVSGSTGVRVSTRRSS